MLIINNKKYASNKKEFGESLFSSQTCSGFYKKFRKGVLLCDHQGEAFAFVFNKGRFERGIVSCSKKGNCYKFMSCIMTVDENKLGYKNGLRYGENVRLADRIIEEIYPEQGSPIAL